MKEFSFIIVAILLCTSLIPVKAQLPPGFSNELVTDDLFRALAFTFLPDGQILILEKDGQMKIGGPITSVPIVLSTFMTIPDIDPSGEHGLIQIALDPDFTTNGYFYLYYTPAGDGMQNGKNRVSRFQDIGDPVSRLNSELMIWEATHSFGGCCHTGGALVFAQDGSILLTTGDDFDNQSSQDLTHSNGKVHRFYSDGSIPIDNPYYDTTPGRFNAIGQLKSIYASGLRNPFRGKFDTQLNRLFVGEVGGNNQAFAWEDLHSIQLGEAGINFGWPACGDGSTGRESNGDCSDPLYTDPIYTYPHSGSGAAIIGGVFYRAFQFPNSYHNKYFYGDYVRNWIKYIDFDQNLNVLSNTMFDENPGLMLDFEVGPDGYLYYVRVLTGSGTIIGTAEIRRYVYNNPNNTAPECISTSASPDSGPGPSLNVDFDATLVDADGDTMQYTWYFGDGNTFSGTVPASSILPTHTHLYTSMGLKQARLFVTDSFVTTACDVIPITVGIPPTSVILSPGDSSWFRGGDTIHFQGIASDPDGLLDSTNLIWYISFYNDGTIHPRQGPDTGLTTSFIIPVNNHVPFVGNTGYIATFVVTDSHGLVATQSIFLRPEKSMVNLNSSPSGLTILLDGVSKTTPFSFEELINFEFELGALDQCYQDSSFEFLAWSDSGMQVHSIIIPDSTVAFAASHTYTGNCIYCDRGVTFDGVDDRLTLTSDVIVSDDFTIEFWAKLDPGISNPDQPMGNGIDQNINFFAGRVRIYAPGTHGNDPIVANFVTPPDEWHHYTFVRENDELYLYIDGAIDQTNTSSWISDFTIALLGTTLTTTGYFAGELDEIRIWNLAKSASDILNSYDHSIDPQSTGLEAYWRFNQADGIQEIPDVTGNGYSAYMGTDTTTTSNDPVLTENSLMIIDDCDGFPSCFDHTLNGDETGIDCGGMVCLPCVILGGDCPQLLNLIGLTINENGIYQSDSLIISNNAIQNLTNVEFHSAIEIDLLPEFSVTQGVEFIAKIKDCVEE